MPPFRSLLSKPRIRPFKSKLMPSGLLLVGVFVISAGVEFRVLHMLSTPFLLLLVCLFEQSHCVANVGLKLCRPGWPQLIEIT